MFVTTKTLNGACGRLSMPGFCLYMLHPIPGTRDNLTEGASRRPMQSLLRPRNVGHQRGRIARAPRKRFLGQDAVYNRLRARDHLFDRMASAAAEVERHGFAPCGEVSQRRHMTGCQVADVD